MTVSTIIIVIICFSVIIHHLYKIKDELNDIKEKLNEISNYQIDGCVEDIEDKGDGAKWADETMIEKACEWLKENIDIYAKVVINPKSHYPEIVMCDTFEKNFKKTMEEELCGK